MMMIAKTTIKTGMVLAILTLFSCNKEVYKKYENMEVLEDSYTGNIDITSKDEDSGGDFTGNGDSGTYSFAWENPQKRASADFDITTSSGSVQMIIEDALGDEVLNKTRTAGGNDSFSGVSSGGKAGTWLVTIHLTDFNGDGSFSLHPGD